MNVKFAILCKKYHYNGPHKSWRCLEETLNLWWQYHTQTLPVIRLFEHVSYELKFKNEVLTFTTYEVNLPHQRHIISRWMKNNYWFYKENRCIRRCYFIAVKMYIINYTGERGKKRFTCRNMTLWFVHCKQPPYIIL